MKTLKKLGALASIVYFYYWLTLFNIEITIVMVGSLLIHEAGHYGIAYKFGQKPRLEVIPIFGFLVRFDKKHKKLTHRQYLLFYLAGPIASFGLVCLGLIFKNNFMFFINMIFVWSNLLPIYFSDGNGMLYVLRITFGEKIAKVITPSTLLVLILGLAMLLLHSEFWLVLLLIAFKVKWDTNELPKETPDGSMSEKKAEATLVLYLVVVFVTLYFSEKALALIF